jgi:hypothetical protein
MASGKKNYFRHSIFARKDSKIVQLIDEHGKEAYFHFFALLELCAEIASSEFPPTGEFVFRRSTLCHELRVTNSRLGRHLVAMQSALLCDVVLTENECKIVLPKLAKYMGKYESKLTPNSPNKRKEKERKEKERKEKERKEKEDAIVFSVDSIIQQWNDFALSHGFESNPLAADGHLYSDCQLTLQALAREGKTFRDYLVKIEASKAFLKRKKGAAVSLRWIMNERNYFKIMGGSFVDNNTQSSNQEYINSIKLSE